MRYNWIIFILIIWLHNEIFHSIPNSRSILKDDQFKQYFELFNREDEDIYVQYVSNNQSWEFMKEMIPLFECSDPEIEKTYYFRWWTFRKHIKLVDKSIYSNQSFYVITEFLPAVSWGGIYNTISCAAAHHIREGRWLHNPVYIDDYIRFWFREGHPRKYSFWIAHSIRSFYLVTGNMTLSRDTFISQVDNFKKLQHTNYFLKYNMIGLYFNTDNRDGMERSIGGFDGTRSYRPTLNSYQYGEAMSLSQLASDLGYNYEATTFRDFAEDLKKVIENKLWDPIDRFYKPLSYHKNQSLSKLADVKELIGYSPWYFNIPDENKLDTWSQIMDKNGFYSNYGLTTAEQRHPKFIISYTDDHECLWNGPIWPYATSMTLTALANTLNRFSKQAINKYINNTAFYRSIQNYAKSHKRIIINKYNVTKEISWIDENINPYNGDWISRTILMTWDNNTWSIGKGGKERGKDYNHSTFIDLIINGLIGLRPKSNNIIVVNPLIPPHTLSYFCIDSVLYHGSYLTIFWDETGTRYNYGIGLHILVNGTLVAHSTTISKLKFHL
eukprot:gene13119-17584_t